MKFPLLKMPVLINGYGVVDCGGGYILNEDFRCGLYGWMFDPAYPAVLSIVPPSQGKIEAISGFGSFLPVELPTESATWRVTVEVVAITGAGKISFRKPNGTWVNHSFDTIGLHSAEYTGVINELHVGADGDDNFECIFDSIVLDKVSKKRRKPKANKKKAK